MINPNDTTIKSRPCITSAVIAALIPPNSVKIMTNTVMEIVDAINGKPTTV